MSHYTSEDRKHIYAFTITSLVHLAVTCFFFVSIVIAEYSANYFPYLGRGMDSVNKFSYFYHFFELLISGFLLAAHIKVMHVVGVTHSMSFLVRAAFFVFIVLVIVNGPMNSSVGLLPNCMFTFSFIVLSAIAIKLRHLPNAALEKQSEYIPSTRHQTSYNTQTTNSDRQDDSTPADQVKYLAKYSDYTFKDIEGMEEIKDRLLPAAKLIMNSSGQEKAKIRNGILLSGDPGNGKTFFVEALAGEIGLPLISFSFGDAASRYVNNTTENVMQLFKDARSQEPCILFMDEIDSFIKERHSNNASEESGKTTNTILTEIDELRSSRVIVIGATNFLDKLDPAAIRPGRFDFKIEILPPDELARVNLLYSSILKSAPNTDYDEEALLRLSKRWSGFSVARIQAVGQEVGELVRKNYLDYIDADVLMQALRLVQGRKSKVPESTKNLSDLFFNADLKEQLSAIVETLKESQRIEELGGTVPTGLLFYGPAGTGKSETVRSIAKQASYGFLATSGHALVSDNDAISNLIKEARDIRPCIVFIDEADDILADRESSNLKSFANELLIAMDGSGGKIPDVLFVAATNNPENIDDAFLRSGRFTEKFYFNYPNHEVRKDFIEWWKCRNPAKFSLSVDANVIATIVGDQISVANLHGLLQKAVNIMISQTPRDSIGEVTLKHIEDAKRILLL